MGTTTSKNTKPVSLKEHGDNDIQRGACQTSLGSVGYQIISKPTQRNHKQKTPIVCFHSSPRSSDEFVDIMPFLSNNRTIIAIDSPGYGFSSNPNKSCSLEDVAECYLDVLRQLNLIEYDIDSTNNEYIYKSSKRLILMGSLMGNFVSLSLASRYSNIISACILINLYFFPQPSESDTADTTTQSNFTRTWKLSQDQSIPDSWQVKEDGSMLVDLWNKRKSWTDPDLNLRLVQSELTYLTNRRVRYRAGIIMQDLDSMVMEEPASKTSCPVLAMKGIQTMDFFDRIGLQGNVRFDKACSFLKDCMVVELEGIGSNVNLVNQMAKEISMHVKDFLVKIDK